MRVSTKKARSGRRRGGADARYTSALVTASAMRRPRRVSTARPLRAASGWRSRRLAYDGVVLGDLEDGILRIEAEDYDPRTILLSIDDGHIVHHYKPLPID